MPRAAAGGAFWFSLAVGEQVAIHFGLYRCVVHVGDAAGVKFKLYLVGVVEKAAEVPLRANAFTQDVETVWRACRCPVCF